MFTFKKNKYNLAIAKIEKKDDKSKKKNKRILYLDIKNIDGKSSKNMEEDDIKEDDTYRLICCHCLKRFSRPDYVKRHQKYSCKMNQFENIIDNHLKKILNLEKEDESDSNSENEETIIKAKEKSFNEHTLIKKEIFIPLPNFDKREVVYIAGGQDSGKSYYASEYIKEFEKMFPDKKIYLFSRVNEDEAFSKIKRIKRIKLDEEFLNNITDCKKDLYNSICIFDDIDSIIDKRISDAIKKLRDDVIMSGRDQTNGKGDIYCIVTNHQTTDYRSTRDILANATSVTIFPQNRGNIYGANRCLKYYCGLNKEQIDKIYSLDSRWVTIYRNRPNYVISEKKIYKL
jgi:hypothetical protein